MSRFVDVEAACDDSGSEMSQDESASLEMVVGGPRQLQILRQAEFRTWRRMDPKFRFPAERFKFVPPTTVKELLEREVAQGYEWNRELRLPVEMTVGSISESVSPVQQWQTAKEFQTPSAASSPNFSTATTVLLPETAAVQTEALSGGITSVAFKSGKTMKFSSVLCTWPKLDEAPFVIHQRIMKSFPGAKAIVSREKHQDGTFHIHAAVFGFNKNYRTFSEFDSWANKHGDYKKITAGDRSKRDVIKYVAKGGEYHDPDGLLEWANGESPKKKPKFSQLIMDELMKGSAVVDVVTLYPAPSLHGLKAIQEMRAFLDSVRRAKEIPPEPYNGVQIVEGLHDKVGPVNEIGLTAIADWFTSQVIIDRELPRYKRPLRSPQLHIVGPPGIGKTSFIAALQNKLKVYMVPTEESWMDTFEDGVFDIAVVDEFCGGKTISWLNRWLDGGTIWIPIKGKSAVWKTQNIPTVILGNKTMEEIFKDAAAKRDVSLEALCAPHPRGRLLTVKLEDEGSGLLMKYFKF